MPKIRALLESVAPSLSSRQHRAAATDSWRMAKRQIGREPVHAWRNLDGPSQSKAGNGNDRSWIGTTIWILSILNVLPPSYSRPLLIPAQECTLGPLPQTTYSRA